MPFCRPGAGRARDRRGDDARRPDLVDGELHRLRRAQADAVGRLGDRVAELGGEPGGVDLVDGEAAALGGGDGVLGHGDDVAGLHVGSHILTAHLGEVVAARDHTGLDGQAREHVPSRGREQVLACDGGVRAEETLRLGRARLGGRAPGGGQQRRHARVGGRGHRAAALGPDLGRRREGRLDVGIFEHHAAVAELAQPELDVGGPPEERRLLDLAATAVAKRAHERHAVPVLPRPGTSATGRGS